MTITLITSMSALGLEEYGARFLKSYSLWWPDTVECRIYSEDKELQDALGFLPLPPECLAFVEKHKDNPKRNGSLGYRRNAVKFCMKVYAMCAAARELSGKMIWLDADVVIRLPVTEDWLESLLPPEKFCSYLGRISPHTETGFLMFDLDHPVSAGFFARWQHTYDADECSKWNHLPGLTDCDTFDFERRSMDPALFHNLSRQSTGHVFVSSVLGERLDHLKGSRKRLGFSPEGHWEANRARPN